jgi:hypothetical protein
VLVYDVPSKLVGVALEKENENETSRQLKHCCGSMCLCYCVFCLQFMMSQKLLIKSRWKHSNKVHKQDRQEGRQTGRQADRRMDGWTNRLLNGQTPR